ncbi:hypothetical protein OUZ56_021176 [Daphnia magna]|uniref:AN1-type domain-containing protein n=1 Tax=Daphnia magna TaxID=35525 RepID=A0ABQ9ZGM6_9CRUS|nr:hypothetical protein OUZ56_021176 [Daphnia magna]
MEFPSLGERCSMAMCQQLDLLPIRCSYCQKHFCKAHFQPFDHSCSSYHDSSSKLLETPSPEMHICSLSNCSAKELICMSCSFCDLHFCLQHRHQVDHQCSKLEKPVEKMVQTAELVKQIQLKNMGKKTCRGVKSEKLAAKVQLMKLKQNSTGKPHLNLFSPAGDCLSENKDVTIAELIDEEALFNGQTVVMKYVDQ